MVDLNIELPEGFLDEEVRCGYTVTRQMKEVWAVELDLLNILLDVCKKHNIKIFASGGTLLGAVRHKGFIPWDDDIDMMMYRDDYEKLCQVAPYEFEYPYFFQTEYTDPGSLRGHAQLRNTETTGILKSEVKKRYLFNQGIFLDIFPLDAVCDSKNKYLLQKARAKFLRTICKGIAKISTRYIYNNDSLVSKISNFLHDTLDNHLNLIELEKDFYRLYEKECQRFNTKQTKMISTLGFVFYEPHFKYRADFTEFTLAPFEFLEIPITKDFDHALTNFYGNYMEMRKENPNHGGVIFDTNNSFCKFFDAEGQ